MITTIVLMRPQLTPLQRSEQVTNPWWTAPASAAAPAHQKVRRQWGWTSRRRPRRIARATTTRPRARSVSDGAGSHSMVARR